MYQLSQEAMASFFALSAGNDSQEETWRPLVLQGNRSPNGNSECSSASFDQAEGRHKLSSVIESQDGDIVITVNNETQIEDFELNVSTSSQVVGSGTGINVESVSTLEASASNKSAQPMMRVV